MYDVNGAPEFYRSAESHMPRERNSAAEVVKIIRIFISILKEVQK
jgi:hypothetical protein